MLPEDSPGALLEDFQGAYPADFRGVRQEDFQDAYRVDFLAALPEDFQDAYPADFRVSFVRTLGRRSTQRALQVPQRCRPS